MFSCYSDNLSYFLAELPTPDEVESYLVLQECLELRECYVFREAIAPWEKEIISDPSTPKPNPNPFYYTPEKRSNVSFLTHISISVIALWNSRIAKN